VKVCYMDTYVDQTECINQTNPQVFNSVTISGLEACRHYEFAIAAVSVTGELGPITTHEVVMDDTAPGPVQNLTVEALSSSALIVSYDPPLIRPECAAQYDLHYVQILETQTNTVRNLNAPQSVSAQPIRKLNTRPIRRTIAARIATVMKSADHTSVTIKTGSLEHVFIQLESCSTYEVTVNAVSQSHQSGPSTSAISSTLDEKPAPPTELRTLDTTETSITFAWLAPENRFCVSSYEIEYAPTDSSDPAVHVSVPNTNYALELLQVVSDLEKCTTYNFIVASEGVLGSSSGGVLTQATLC